MHYTTMSDAIQGYVEDSRRYGLNVHEMARQIEIALQSALGDHLIATVSIEWRKGENYGEDDS